MFWSSALLFFYSQEAKKRPNVTRCPRKRGTPKEEGGHIRSGPPFTVAATWGGRDPPQNRLAQSQRQTVLAVHRSKLKGKWCFFFVVTVISHCFLNHPCFHAAYLSLYMFGTGWLHGSTDGHCFIPKISSSSGLGWAVPGAGATEGSLVSHLG